MSSTSIRRAFIVGCPRSGTTLLQSLLAAHDPIVSFPETHFFNYCCAESLRDRLLDARHAELRSEMRAYFERLDRPKWARAFSTWYPLRRRYARLLQYAFDAIAVEERASVWIEKTPSHLERIDAIEGSIDDPYFIHIVRSGADTVASLHAVTHEYPEEWSGARSIDRCIDRWLQSVAETDRHLDAPNHVAVQYEELATHPAREMRRLCAFVGVDFEPEALGDHRRAAERVVEEDEPWKETNREAIREPSSQRFYERFDAEQRAQILRRLHQTETSWPVEPAGAPEDADATA